MKFDFFTFGGSFFWEDVFFYKKWRIQRHCFQKKYRLLDSWDIRRASGTFETCQKEFIKYIESYEITRQHGKMIVLLHGYADGKNIFKKLWRKLMLTNANVAALNYPSLFRGADASANQILFFLNHLEDINEVSFVTKGAGNIVLQKVFDMPLEQQVFREKMRIGNIVEINPVVKENLLCEFLLKYRFFRFILGPMSLDFSEKKLKNLPSLPSEYRSLKIFSDSISYRVFCRLLKVFFAPFDEKQFKKRNSLYIKGNSFRTLGDEKVLNVTVNFVNNGKI